MTLCALLPSLMPFSKAGLTRIVWWTGVENILIRGAAMVPGFRNGLEMEAMGCINTRATATGLLCGCRLLDGHLIQWERFWKMPSRALSVHMATWRPLKAHRWWPKQLDCVDWKTTWNRQFRRLKIHVTHSIAMLLCPNAVCGMRLVKVACLSLLIWWQRAAALKMPYVTP